MLLGSEKSFVNLHEGARMPVPKLVKNGFNSSFGVLVSFEGMDSEWITETIVNGKK
jgi:hypothetical protein